VLAGACWAATLSAGEVGEREPATINTSVVTAKKISPPDEEVKKQVETALHADAYFYDAQVTVSVKGRCRSPAGRGV